MKTILEYIQKKHMTSKLQCFGDIDDGCYFKACKQENKNYYFISKCTKANDDNIYCELSVLKQRETDKHFIIYSSQHVPNNNYWVFTNANEEEISMYDKIYNELKNNSVFKQSIKTKTPELFAQYEDGEVTIL